jgi:hypothetical protein
MNIKLMDTGDVVTISILVTVEITALVLRTGKYPTHRCTFDVAKHIPKDSKVPAWYSVETWNDIPWAVTYVGETEIEEGGRVNLVDTEVGELVIQLCEDNHLFDLGVK